MSGPIDRQAAIDALADMHCKSDEDGYVWIIRSDAWARIDALPSAQPEITLESAIDYLHSIGWMQEHDRILTESAQPELPSYVAEIEEEYQKAVKSPYIHKPLAKALYEVWKKHDREDAERKVTDGGLD